MRWRGSRYWGGQLGRGGDGAGVELGEGEQEWENGRPGGRRGTQRGGGTRDTQVQGVGCRRRGTPAGGMKSRAGGYASVVDLDEAVGAPQGGPHLPQACNTALGERRRNRGPAPSPTPISHLSPCAPGTRRPHRGRRNRNAPGTRQAPVPVPTRPPPPAALPPTPSWRRRPFRCVTPGATRGEAGPEAAVEREGWGGGRGRRRVGGPTPGGRADAGWAGRCPEQASLSSAPGRHGGAAAYGARGAYGGPDGGSWRHGGCRAPRGARHPPYRGSWYPPCRGAWSPTRSPAAPSPSAHPRARPDTVPAGRHPLPHRQHQLVLAP